MKRESLKEFRDRLRTVRPLIDLTYGELFVLEASGDHRATQELNTRDAVYSSLGQG